MLKRIVDKPKSNPDPELPIDPASEAFIVMTKMSVEVWAVDLPADQEVQKLAWSQLPRPFVRLPRPPWPGAVRWLYYGNYPKPGSHGPNSYEPWDLNDKSNLWPMPIEELTR